MACQVELSDLIDTTLLRQYTALPKAVRRYHPLKCFE